MKLTKTCPKCASRQVVYKKGKSSAHSGKINLTTWIWGNLERYICLDCGFFEEYLIKDKKFIKWVDKVQKKRRKSGDLDDDFIDYV